MKNKLIVFWVIMAIVIASIVTIAVKPTKLGLDLIGGSRLVLEANPADNAPVTPEMMSRLHTAIDSRVNKLGVSETVVQRSGDKRLVVEIPNVSDLNQAKEYLGETAELDFRKLVTQADGSNAWVTTGVTGKDLKNADYGTDAMGNYQVNLEFNIEGTKKIAKVTAELLENQWQYFSMEIYNHILQ